MGQYQFKFAKAVKTPITPEVCLFKCALACPKEAAAPYVLKSALVLTAALNSAVASGHLEITYEADAFINYKLTPAGLNYARTHKQLKSLACLVSL